MLEADPVTQSVFDQLWPSRDRERLDFELAEYLEESRRRYVGNPHLRPVFGRVVDFVLHGGKRLRPRLCLAAYRILSGCPEPPARPVWRVAASLELFHAFMLVHDDLIDGSVVRRDHDALHQAIRLDLDAPGPGAAKRAADLGLIAGDLLFALGMRLVSRSGLDGEAALKANRLLADMLFETGLGEALDVLYEDRPLDRLDEEHILEAYLRKTARYSVSGPLVLGATLAGASASTCRALDRLGDRLGLGYQVGNDLDALDADPDQGDHPDLDGGKRTLVLWKAHDRLPDSGRRALALALGLPPGPDRRRRLLDLIDASGAVAECRAFLGSIQAEAAEVLRRAPLDPAQRRSFFALTALFRPESPPAEPALVADRPEITLAVPLGQGPPAGRA